MNTYAYFNMVRNPDKHYPQFVFRCEAETERDADVAARAAGFEPNSLSICISPVCASNRVKDLS